MPQQNNDVSNAKKSGLVGVVGLLAAAILTTIVPRFEGTELIGYRDPIGIATKCMGDTTNVVVGKRYTKEECQLSLEKQLIAHAEGVLKCTPILRDRTYQLIAATSFAYNIGVGAYCNSQTAALFNVGNFKAGCMLMNESFTGKPQWVTAGGKVLPGLVKRRKEERALCESDLTG